MSFGGGCRACVNYLLNLRDIRKISHRCFVAKMSVIDSHKHRDMFEQSAIHYMHRYMDGH